MIILNVLNFLGQLGWRFSLKEIPKAIHYLTEMINHDRVLGITIDDEPSFFMAYSVTDDPNPYLRKGTWDYLPHDPLGKVVVIEIMASRKFNKRIMFGIRKALLSKYPQLKSGVWRRGRFPHDKIVTVRRDIYEQV